MGKIGFPSEKNDSKNIEKNNVAIGLHVLCAKKNKHILFLFQNISQIMKNGFKWRMVLPCGKETISVIKRNNV